MAMGASSERPWNSIRALFGVSLITSFLPSFLPPFRNQFLPQLIPSFLPWVGSHLLEALHRTGVFIDAPPGWAPAILAEGAMTLPVTLSGGVLFAS